MSRIESLNGQHVVLEKRMWHFRDKDGNTMFAVGDGVGEITEELANFAFSIYAIAHHRGRIDQSIDQAKMLSNIFGFGAMNMRLTNIEKRLSGGIGSHIIEDDDSLKHHEPEDLDLSNVDDNILIFPINEEPQ